MSEKNINNLIVSMSGLVDRMDALVSNLSALAQEQTKMVKQQSAIIMQLNKQSTLLVNHERRIAKHDSCRHFDPQDPNADTVAVVLPRKR